MLKKVDDELVQLLVSHLRESQVSRLDRAEVDRLIKMSAADISRERNERARAAKKSARQRDSKFIQKDSTLTLDELRRQVLRGRKPA